MKIQEYTIKNKKVLHIYVNQEEYENKQIKSKFENIENTNLVWFISGEKEIEKSLKEIIKMIQNC